MSTGFYLVCKRCNSRVPFWSCWRDRGESIAEAHAELAAFHDFLLAHERHGMAIICDSDRLNARRCSLPREPGEAAVPANVAAKVTADDPPARVGFAVRLDQVVVVRSNINGILLADGREVHAPPDVIDELLAFIRDNPATPADTGRQYFFVSPRP